MKDKNKDTNMSLSSAKFTTNKVTILHYDNKLAYKGQILSC
jgi:hypothetical protein